MTERHQKLGNYVREILGIPLLTREWKGIETIPLFLQQKYEIRTAKILRQMCLFLIDKENKETPPAILKKHIGLIHSKDEREIIYVRDSVSSYNRKRLIDQRISFIVPGNQMYLPLLGIDFREHFRRNRACDSSSSFAPSTQVLLISWLLGKTNLHPTATELAPPLGYAKMTMKRAIDELESLDYISVTTEGKEKRLLFRADKREVWQSAIAYLRSPVKKRHYVRYVKHGTNRPKAGLSALSHYSMLATPRQESVAVSLHEWKSMRKHEPEFMMEMGDPETTAVELWAYDPTLFSSGGYVDQLSLYLSLKDDQDERVESATSEMMGGLEWL